MQFQSDRSRRQQAVQLACWLEAAARKPGNVHPAAAFGDLTFEDFTRSADAVAPILAQTGPQNIGRTIRMAVEASRKVARSNANLGIVLLAAPLMAAGDDLCPVAIRQVLDRTTIDDAMHVYAAIRHAAPGGLGQVDDNDVSQAPRDTLLNVMRQAAGRDRIAEQYATGFALIFEHALPELLRRQQQGNDWETAIIGLHLFLMAGWPDTLIARKCGTEAAAESARRAEEVLQRGWPHTAGGQEAIRDLDTWLRREGHRYNPGTTADLVAATLLAALLRREFVPPSPAERQQHLQQASFAR